MSCDVLLQNWFLYFFGASFNAVGLLLMATLGRHSVSSMFSGLSPVPRFPPSTSTHARMQRSFPSPLCAFLPARAVCLNQAAHMHRTIRVWGLTKLSFSPTIKRGVHGNAPDTEEGMMWWRCGCGRLAGGSPAGGKQRNAGRPVVVLLQVRGHNPQEVSSRLERIGLARLPTPMPTTPPCLLSLLTLQIALAVRSPAVRTLVSGEQQSARVNA